MATAKKAPAKKPAKTVAKKSTTKKPTKQVAAAKKNVATKKVAKTEARPARTQLSPIERIRSVNLSAAFSAILFAVITAVFVGPASAELLLNFQARDSFANLDSVVLGSASEVLLSIEYCYVLIAALLVSAVGSILLATKLRKTYEASVTAGVPAYRWLFMGLSAALIFGYVNFIGGVTDIMTLKIVAALILATVVFSWIADRDNAASKDQKWLAFGASLFTGALAWLPLIGSLVGTTVFGDQRFGWHVYALAAVTLAGFAGFALTQYASIKKKTQLEYIVFENRYLRIDQITKFLIVLITVAALQK